MDPWHFLQAHTAARIAQGRTGNSLPTTALLRFQLDHARARDAVYAALDTDRLLAELAQLVPQPLLLQSQASLNGKPDRHTYLQRPDLGRRLDADSRTLLETLAPAYPPDLCIMLADGLSATAINRHAVPVLATLLPALAADGWQVAPICLVQQGRVAIADQVAHALRANITLILIGERPGLTSPHSLGAYLTYVGPQVRIPPGLTDEARNCVSNIRPEGMPCLAAAEKIQYLLTQMKTRKLSGVQLKDEMPWPGLLSASGQSDLMLPR